MKNGKSKASWKSKSMSRAKKSYSKKSKKPAKKSYRKSGSKVAQLASQLKKLQLLNKLSQQSFRIGCREANNLNESGKITLLNHDATGIKPIHIYPLSNVYQAGSTEPAGYTVRTNMYDLQSLYTDHNATPSNLIKLEYMGSDGNTLLDCDNIKARNLIHSYSNIQLTLRGQASRTSLFTCYLVKFKDDTFDPSENTTVADTLSRRQRSSFFTHLLRNNMNPCIKGEKILTDDVKKQFSVLWKKQYKIREGLSTEDVLQHKYIKIFRKFDKICQYSHEGNPASASGVDQDNPDDQPAYVDPSLMTFRNNPSIDQNTFFIITGNCPDDNSTCSYDINIVNKFIASDLQHQF